MIFIWIICLGGAHSKDLESQAVYDTYIIMNKKKLELRNKEEREGLETRANNHHS